MPPTVFETRTVIFPERRVESQRQHVRLSVGLDAVTDFWVSLQSFSMQYTTDRRQVRNLGIGVENQQIEGNEISFDAVLTFNNGNPRPMSGTATFLVTAVNNPESIVPVNSLRRGIRYRIRMNNETGAVAKIDVSGFAGLDPGTSPPPYVVLNGSDLVIFATMPNAPTTCGAGLVFKLATNGSAFTNAYAPDLPRNANCTSAVRRVRAYNTREEEALVITLRPT